MEGKSLYFDLEARTKLLEGVTKLTKAVACTLGPRGRNVIIRNEFVDPYMTKDGVSVAKQIRLADPIEDAGAQLVQQAADRTVQKAGDGTSSSVVLAHALFSEGVKHVGAGVNATAIKRGMEIALEKAIKEIEKRSIPITNTEGIKSVAMISANGDEEIANLIAEGMTAVGDDGVVTVGESKTKDTFLEVISGLRIDEGYVSPYFINQKGTKKCTLDDCLVFMTDRKITSTKEIVPILSYAFKQRKSLLILAENVEGEALATMVLNAQNGRLQGCAVRAPGYGGVMKDTLDDLAALVGGVVLSENAAMSFNDINENNAVNFLGQANRVEVTDKGTVFWAGDTTVALEERIKFLKDLLKEETDTERQEAFRKRIARLSGGIAVIKAGALTNAELRERIDRIDDALQATRAAKAEGIVPGGGGILKYVADSIRGNYDGEDAEEKLGYSVVVKALEAPLKTLAVNSGVEIHEALMATVVEGNQYQGINFRTLQKCFLIKEGIIDPTLVTKTALSNAVSVASMLLTANCVVSEHRKGFASKDDNVQAVSQAMINSL